jgi:hypothetical protein
MTTLTLDTGERLKRLALVRLEPWRKRLIRSARRALVQHLLDHGTGTIDGVRATVDVPVGIDLKAFGAVPRVLAAAGLIRVAGSTKTARAVGHARRVTVWELADPTAAVAWLNEHPELSEPSVDPPDAFVV